jgi:hypothetical protein
VVSFHLSVENISVCTGLPFPKAVGIPMNAQESIRTLLGPRPHVNKFAAGSGSQHEIEVQKNALIAYRAKVVALIGMLEGGVKGSWEQATLPWSAALGCVSTS